MSNRYEEVIRLVLDVETDKLEKKTVEAQDRANRKAAQNAAHTAEARVGPSPRAPRQGPATAGARGTGTGSDPASLYRALGNVAASIMRGRLPGLGDLTHAIGKFRGLGGAGGGGRTGTSFGPVSQSRATTNAARAAVNAGNGGTLGSERPPGMPPTPPAPPRRMPPPIPPGAPRLPGGGAAGAGGGRGAAGLFRSAMGSLGGGGAAGTAGIAALAAFALRNTITGIRQQFAGVGTMGKSFVSGNPSQLMKGAVQMVQGMVRQFFGPLLGPLASKLVGVYGKFIDVLDGLVAALGKYNPVVNAQARILEVQQKMFRMRMANVMQPLMSAWISLKSTVLDLMAQLLPLLRPVVGFFASFLSAANSFLRGIKAAFIDIVAAFKWVKGMLTGDFKSFSKVREEVRRGADANSLDNAARQYNQSFANAGRTLALPSSQRAGGFLRASSPQPVLRLPGRQRDSTRPMREPGESLPRQATAGKDNRPSLPTPPGRPQFQQNVQNHWKFQLAAEKAINETVMQVRDKLTMAMFSARDEARLVGSLLMGGASAM